MTAARHIYNLYQAKSELSSLVDRAAAGEDIIIAKAGVPMARLVPIGARRMQRKPGGWVGKVRISRDFDDPLPAEIQRSFEGPPDEDE